MEQISNKKLGNGFEGYVKKCLLIRGFEVTRVPDGCRRIPSGAGFKLIPVKSPFDFFCCKNKKAIFFDAKTTQGETFPYSKIDQSQVKELLKYHNNGFVAGYIVNFRQNNTFGFINAKLLSEVVERGSVSYKACVMLGEKLDVEALFGESKTA